MKKNISQLMLMVFITAAFFSCKKEAPLTASTENQGYVVPQGNHDYDATIVSFYQKYGKYLLYEFEGKDTYWTPSAWKQASPSTTTEGFWNPGYEATPADPLYVGQLLTLIQDQWFDLYTEKFLKEFLPVKIMLCSAVDSVYTKFNFVSTPSFHIEYEKVEAPVPAWYNYDNICVNNANDGIESMTDADIKKFRTNINRIFINSMIGRKLFTPTDLFTNIANYASATTTAKAYEQGVLYPYYGTSSTDDWGKYVMAMVTTSEATLNDANTANYDTKYKGILNTTKDVNGKIKKRYDIVRNYYIDNYGVDLQAIGNLTAQ